MTNTIPATPDSLAGHSVMQMLDVAMSSIIGDYDDADLVPEWQWVKRMASHEHVGVKDDSAYEFTLNLAMELDAIPPALHPLLTAAQQAGVNYILFYNGEPPRPSHHSSTNNIKGQPSQAGPLHHWSHRT